MRWPSIPHPVRTLRRRHAASVFLLGVAANELAHRHLIDPVRRVARTLDQGTAERAALAGQVRAALDDCDLFAADAEHLPAAWLLRNRLLAIANTGAQ